MQLALVLNFYVKSNKIFRIKKPYVLLSPGTSSHRPKKRWPETKYVELARKFIQKKITPVLLGNFEDIKVADFIAMNTNGCINLVDKTSIQDLCVLAREAQIAIGNDIFEAGQTYVALSRIKNLDGLYLKSFNYKKIRANKKVKQFYTNLN